MKKNVTSSKTTKKSSDRAAARRRPHHAPDDDPDSKPPAVSHKDDDLPEMIPDTTPTTPQAAPKPPPHTASPGLDEHRKLPAGHAAASRVDPDEELRQAKLQAMTGRRAADADADADAELRQAKEMTRTAAKAAGTATAAAEPGARPATTATDRRAVSKELALAPGVSASDVSPPDQQPVSIHPEEPPVLQVTQSSPGAVAIQGVDAGAHADDEMDNILQEEGGQEVVSPPPAVAATMTAGAPTSRVESHIPEAQIVTEDEEGDAGQEFIDELAHAEPASPEELMEEEVSKGIMGWIKSHRVLSGVLVVLIVGAIVGGVVGASVGGKSGSSETPVPSSAPSMSPTPAPTFVEFESVVETLSQITPIPVLLNPNTPQHAAVSWLLLEDMYDLNFGDAPRLLQRYALATIYFATVGANWTNQLQFLSNQDDCFWNETVNEIVLGVQSCNQDGFVNKLRFTSNGLQGTFPDEISGLPLLDFLDFAVNNVGGTIPGTISQLTDLTALRLGANRLSGSFPDDLGALNRTTDLRVNSNVLTGEVPSSVGQMTLLTTLDLSTNKLSGVIPSELGRLTNLKNIYLNENDLTGGVEVAFCEGCPGTCKVDFTNLWADCLSLAIPFTPAEVECFCCTICCADGETCQFTTNRTDT